MKTIDFTLLEPRLHVVASMLLSFPNYTPIELKEYLKSIDIDINTVYKQLEACEIVKFTSGTTWKVHKSNAKNLIKQYQEYEDQLVLRLLPDITDYNLRKAVYYLHGYEKMNPVMIQRKLEITYEKALKLRDELVNQGYAEFCDISNKNKGIQLKRPQF